MCNSYPSFIAEMRKVFDYPIQGGRQLIKFSRSIKVLHLWQSMKLSSGFWQLSPGGMNYPYRGVFVFGLADYLKDELATRDETDSLISFAICIDNGIRE